MRSEFTVKLSFTATGYSGTDHEILELPGRGSRKPKPGVKTQKTQGQVLK